EEMAMLEFEQRRFWESEQNRSRPILWASICALVLSVGSTLPSLARSQVVEREVSTYNGSIFVVDDPKTGIRSLITQSGTKGVLQSSLDLRNPVRLVDDYTQIIALITSLHPA